MRNPTAGHLPSADQRRAILFWMAWVIWLPFLVPAVATLVTAPHSWPALLVGLGGGALFVAIYLWATWRNVQRLVAVPPPPEPPLWHVWLPIVALTALSIALTEVNGSSWGGLFIYTSAYTAGRLPPARALPAVAVLVLIVAWGGPRHGLDLAATGSALVFIGIVGLVVLGMVQGMTISRELRLAQVEIARLAATTERLRIARDLHDLLGHNLALIALKSELAGRLLHGAPDRAATEIRDVEQVARTTLQEVRAALAGYRQPTLASELAAAKEILAAAGIVLHYEGQADIEGALPLAVEAALAWTVREGVTNVVKHSRARACAIRAQRDAQTAGIEVTDDGAQDSVGRALADGAGSGLRGLAERVRALGGRFEAGPCPGGFRLAVALPLAAGQEPERGTER